MTVLNEYGKASLQEIKNEDNENVASKFVVHLCA